MREHSIGRFGYGLRHSVLLCVALALALVAVLYAVVPGKSLAAGTQTSAAVHLAGQVIFSLSEPLTGFSAAERARIAESRLADLLTLKGVSEWTPRTREAVSGTEIVVAGTVVVTISNQDALAAGMSREALARDIADRLDKALAAPRPGINFQEIAIQIGGALAVTAGLALLVWLMRRGYRWLIAFSARWVSRRRRGISFKNLEIVPLTGLVAFARAIVRAVALALGLIVAYLYLSLLFGIFPGTRPFATWLIRIFVSAASGMGSGFVDFIPDAISIVLICAVTYYLIRVVRWGFHQLETGTLKLDGFYPEWAMPTFKIARFLILIAAAVAIFPHIPGHDSSSFQGIGVLVGVIFSFGASSSVANIVSGLLLTYMRAFSIGDRVRIADSVGDVLGRDLLVTRVRTIKNEEITIPNAMILSNHIVNYTSAVGHGGLILHTSVTIGYDVPWTTVHKLLLEAAAKTEHILAEPAPFILQTALNDFNITYELNAYTDRPNLMAAIYSKLHEHTQSAFAAADVEILSPHYTSLRDGNPSTVPELKPGQSE